MDSAAEVGPYLVRVKFACLSGHRFKRDCMLQPEENHVELPKDMPACPTCGAEWASVVVGGNK